MLAFTAAGIWFGLSEARSERVKTPDLMVSAPNQGEGCYHQLYLPYRIEYSRAAIEHLRALDAPRRRRILDLVDEQLTHQPLTETRNRKLMRPNPLAPWELRLGDMRVYYEVGEQERVVQVLAVGIKEREVVRIGGEVVRL